MTGFVGLTDSAGQAITTTNPLPIVGAAKVSATGTQTSVASSASDVTLLAANTARLSAMIFNDSTAVVYVLLGAGVSSTSNYSVQIAAGGYFELPIDYTGIIKGIWASANGSARMTEFT